MKQITTIILLVLFVSCNRSNVPFSFVQVCDPQLGMGGYAHDTLVLNRAVDQINEMEVDFVIFCGDLVNHASDSSFSDFLHIISDLDVPYYLVPGNHDVGRIPNDTSLAFYRNTFGKDYYAIHHKGIAFLFTNSQLWIADAGEESQRQDSWFSETLQNIQPKDRIVVIGHYPIYIQEIDEEESYFNFPMDKRTELLDLFSSHNVKAYLSGHKHQLVVNTFKGIQLVTGESTSRNFDDRPMGFRKWDVTKDTLLHSFVAVELPLAKDSLFRIQE